MCIVYTETVKRSVNTDTAIYTYTHVKIQYVYCVYRNSKKVSKHRHCHIHLMTYTYVKIQYVYTETVKKSVNTAIYTYIHANCLT